MVVEAVVDPVYAPDQGLLDVGILELRGDHCHCIRIQH